MEVLEQALDRLDSARALTLRREVAQRLAALGRAERALGHYAEILLEQPDDRSVREEIGRLAGEASAHGQQVEALVAAGDREASALGLELISEAARLAERTLCDHELAAELFDKALGMEACAGEPRRELYRELIAVLDGLGRQEAKLDALGALLALENDDLARPSASGAIVQNSPWTWGRSARQSRFGRGRLVKTPPI